MVKEEEYTSVPTSPDLENNSNQKKYTINRIPDGRLEISKPLCILLVLAALLLALLVGLLVYFLVPDSCSEDMAPLKVDNDIDERLPRNVEPTHYRVQLVPDLQNSTISGAVTITLKPLEDTDTIIFHVNELTINNHTLSVKHLGGSGNSSPVAVKHQEYLEGYRYKVVLSENMKQGDTYQLETKFLGKLNDHGQGLYRIRYNDEFGNEQHIIASQLAPTEARRVFPCFDEPNFKSIFRISVARPNNMASMSNMPVLSNDISTEKEFTYWDHYEETPKISTYLVAIIIGNLKQSSFGKPPIRVWAREELLSGVSYASTIAPQIFDSFTKYFGENLALKIPKIDIVALPDLGYNAMENVGLITFRESDLLYQPNASIDVDKKRIANELSHEIAHHWFGNLVSPKSWTDLWLSEGFATYFQYEGSNSIEPAGEFSPSEVAMAIDALPYSRPLSFEVKSSKRIRQIFDEISYAKGACVIRMLKHILGEDNFRNGLINYLEKHQNGNADWQDLLASLAEKVQDEEVAVKDVMEGWITKPGFPVVTAVADSAKGQLHISQKRFYLNGKDEKSSWFVPLSFTTKKEGNFHDSKPKFWLKGVHESTVTVNLDTWYLLNINQTGYFIVNYDEKNWNALIQDIMTLPPLTRAQLISDSMDLARANLLDYDIPLRMIAKMAVRDKNITALPTKVALNKLQFLSDMLSATAAFGNFETFHEAIFRDTYDRANFEDKLDGNIRRIVLEWSCRSPLAKCTQNWMTQFRKLILQGGSVDSLLRPFVYCTGIREGNEIEWDFLYNKYLYSNSPLEKNVILDALGHTNLRWLLSKYIRNLVNSSNIRSDEANQIFTSVAKNPYGTTIAFDFLRGNWNELLNRYGDGFSILSKMVKALATNMNTEFELYELERFRDSLKANVSTAEFALQSTIEAVRANVDWMKKNYQHVEKWLSVYKEHFRLF